MPDAEQGTDNSVLWNFEFSALQKYGYVLDYQAWIFMF